MVVGSIPDEVSTLGIDQDDEVLLANGGGKIDGMTGTSDVTCVVAPVDNGGGLGATGESEGGDAKLDETGMLSESDEEVDEASLDGRGTTKDVTTEIDEVGMEDETGTEGSVALVSGPLSEVFTVVTLEIVAVAVAHHGVTVPLVVIESVHLGTLAEALGSSTLRRTVSVSFCTGEARAKRLLPPSARSAMRLRPTMTAIEDCFCVDRRCCEYL